MRSLHGTVQKDRGSIASRSIFMVLPVFLIGAFLVSCATEKAKWPPARYAKSKNEVMDDLRIRLGLTQEQEAKVLPVIEQSAQRKQDAFKIVLEDGASKCGLKDLLEKIQKDNEAQLAPILDKDQMKEYRRYEEGEQSLKAAMAKEKRR